jgi:hypothetical protein
VRLSLNSRSCFCKIVSIVSSTLVIVSSTLAIISSILVILDVTLAIVNSTLAIVSLTLVILDVTLAIVNSTAFGVRCAIVQVFASHIYCFAQAISGIEIDVVIFMSSRKSECPIFLTKI